MNTAMLATSVANDSFSFVPLGDYIDAALNQNFGAAVAIAVLIFAIGVIVTVFTDKSKFMFVGLLVAAASFTGAIIAGSGPSVEAAEVKWGADSAESLSLQTGLPLTAENMFGMKINELKSGDDKRIPGEMALARSQDGASAMIDRYPTEVQLKGDKLYVYVIGEPKAVEQLTPFQPIG